MKEHTRKQCVKETHQMPTELRSMLLFLSASNGKVAKEIMVRECQI